jgi:hypothetical protein
MAKRRLKRALSPRDLLSKKFVTFDFDGAWRGHIGEPEQNFRMIVYGASGNGKTDYLVQFSKYLTQFGRVYYNSFEEGASKTLADAFERHDLQDVEPGSFILGDREPFEDVVRRMTGRNSPRFCFIDSLDYIRMTTEQYQELIEQCPTKSFIIVSWAAGKYPKSQAGKDIEYMVDVKVRVVEYKAYARSRFGGTEPYVIWPEYWERKTAEAAEKARAAAAEKAPCPDPAPKAAPPRPAPRYDLQPEDEDDEPFSYMPLPSRTY